MMLMNVTRAQATLNRLSSGAESGGTTAISTQLASVEGKSSQILSTIAQRLNQQIFMQK